MSSAREDLRVLRRLLPSDHGLTVFDADTQETSYGTLVIDSMPLIFDTHRKGEWFVSTVELLTEVLNPPRVTTKEIQALSGVAGRRGLMTIPYSACFFKGNLHVYAYGGPVRGFDVAALGPSVPEVERKLDERVRSLWSRVPPGILRAQRNLLAGRRKARYPADLEVLVRRKRELGGT